MPSRKPGFHLLDVHLPDERAALARVARVLAEAKVNVDGFLANRGGVQLLTADLAKARKALDAAAYHYKVLEVREERIEDRPGSLAGLCEMLAWDNQNIDTAFGLGTGRQARVYMAVHEEAGRK